MSPGLGRRRRSFIGELRAELQAPVPDTLVGDDHAPLGQDQFDIPQAQAENVVQPDRVADDLGRETVPVIGDGLRCHLTSLAQLTFNH